MAARALSETTADMRDYVNSKVAAAFDSSSAIVDLTVAVYCDDAAEDVLRPIAQRLVREAHESHQAQQAFWPEVTDCDRLDDAFEELNRSGIICRQDFSCCGNCGVFDIRDEIDAEREAGLKVRGYAFYHMQDTESAARGHGLYLSYGSVEDGETAALHIGNAIVETIKSHGLTTNWNGKLDSRIEIQLDWKRRRPIEVFVS